MRHIKQTIWLILLLMFAGCNDSLLNFDDIIVESFIKDNYLLDCKHIYFEEIKANPSHFNFNDPVLDEGEINELLAMLQMVYELETPETDTVFNYYNIHTLYCFSLNSIVMKVDTEAPEIIKLVNKEFPIGSQPLDDLINTYGLDSVRLSYRYPDFPWLSVTTGETYNLLPIIDAFQDLTPVIMAENNGGCTDGDNITIERNKQKATIYFSIGRGDCPAGCISRRYWVFEIKDNEARFVDSYWD